MSDDTRTITLYDLLTAGECAAVERAIAYSTTILPEAPQWLQDRIGALRGRHGKPLSVNRHAYVVATSTGKRSLEDAASLIRSCVRTIHEAELECPTPTDYEDAVNEEQQAYRQWQFLKSQRVWDTDGTRSMKTIRQKHVYEAAKEQRHQIGGQIIGTRSIVRRMYALIAGEILSLQKGER